MLKELGIISVNAAKDMLDEWVLSLCIVLSVAAIACPLLILFGLKQGYVQTIKDHFINDPVYRQITPKETIEYPPEFFTELEQDTRVQLVIPSITSSASVAQLVLSDGSKTRNIDVHPTTDNDPLLVLNESVVPGSGEVVITDSLAKLHGFEVGSQITLAISRRYNKKKQTANETLRVVGIASARANNSHGMYFGLDLTRDIENFRFGRHVERPNWPAGDLPKTRELYDAMIIGCTAELDQAVMSRAAIRTDFKKSDTLGINGHQQLWSMAKQSDLYWHSFTAIGGPVGERAIKRLKSEIRGHGCVHYIPWVNAMKVTVNNEPLKLLGLSVTEKAQRLFPYSFLQASVPFAELQKIALPSQASDSASDTVEVAISTATSNLTLPVTVVDRHDQISNGTALVPSQFLARLRSGDELAIELDTQSGEIIVGDLGYSGFRMYANNIDDVPELAASVQQLGGIAVHAKTDDIVRVKLLERSLNKIVLIVAVVGLIGGAGALIASLVASVERKKAEMSTYRLIGFSRFGVALFPVFQGLIISILSVGIAGLFYVFFSGIVEQVIESSTSAVGTTTGNGLVHVSVAQYLIFAAGMAILSFICASVAAVRSLRIDPAEALRQE